MTLVVLSSHYLHPPHHWRTLCVANGGFGAYRRLPSPKSAAEDGHRRHHRRNRRLRMTIVAIVGGIFDAAIPVGSVPDVLLVGGGCAGYT